MSDLHDRLADLRDDFRPDWDEEKTEQVLAGVPARRRYRRNRTIAASTAACLAIAGIGFLLWSNAPDARKTTPTDLSDSIVQAPSADPNVLVLANGSRITTQRGDRVELIDESADTRMKMGDGRSNFVLTAAPGRTYYLAVGKVALKTAQASFDVESDASGVEVIVLDGSVEVVDANGDEHTLERGARQTFAAVPIPVERRLANGREDEPKGGEPGAVPIVFEPSSKASERKAPRTEQAAPDDESAPKAADTWIELAERGEWKEADDGLEPLETIDGLEKLLLAADVKRYNGQPKAAISLLERATREYPGDERATMAQFQKGRLEMQLGEFAKAAKSWQKVNEMSPSSSLAEDSLSREVEAWFRAGDKAKARERARTYLERYPDGYRAPMVRRYGGVAKP